MAEPRKTRSKKTESSPAPQLQEEVVVTVPKSKDLLQVKLAQEPLYYEDTDSTIYKFSSKEAYKDDGIVGYTDLTRTSGRNYWIRLDGDNPLAKDKGDSLTIKKSSYKPALSVWEDEESGEEYSCTWLIPKDMPYGNLEETEW